MVLTGAQVHDSKVLEELVDAVEPIKGVRGGSRQRPEKPYADKGYYRMQRYTPTPFLQNKGVSGLSRYQRRGTQALTVQQGRCPRATELWILGVLADGLRKGLRDALGARALRDAQASVGLVGAHRLAQEAAKSPGAPVYLKY